MTVTHLTSAARTRRGVLATLLGDRPALIPAGTARGRNYPGNPYPYRASSHFLYFVGLSLPGAALWLDGDDQRLLLPESDPLDALWHAPAVSEELLATTGLRMGNIARLQTLAQGRAVACPPLLSGSDRQRFAAPLGRATADLGHREDVDAALLEAIISLRLRHDQAAQGELRRAAQASVCAHQQGMQATRPGLLERDIVATMESVFTREGFSTAYGSIVTTRGEVLHNHEHGGLLASGDLLLADVGAESDTGYASDITRTWPVSGQFSATQREIYTLVLEAQCAAIDRVRPGIRYRDVHMAAARVLTAGLVDLGIFEGAVDGLLERGCHALFMPHGIGHLLGLDVHDMEDLGDRAGYAPGRQRAAQFGLSYLRLDRDLLAGMAVTIEPGFYQVPLLRAKPELVGLDLRALNVTRLSQFADVRGIRIEDDVLVTEAGHEVLTEALVKSPDAVEQLMAKRARASE